MPALGAPIPASMKSALAAMLKSNQDAQRFFAQGAQRSQCRYALDLTRGFDLIYRPFPKLEKASLFLELSAFYQAESKHAEQAARDLLIGLALADSLGEVPSTLAQLRYTR